MTKLPSIDSDVLARVYAGAGRGAAIGELADRVWKWLGPGAQSRPTPKGAPQFMSPGGDRKIRFDLTPEQHKGAGPHINVENGSNNIHVPLSQ